MFFSKKFIPLIAFCVTFSPSLVACKPTPKVQDNINNSTTQSQNPNQNLDKTDNTVSAQNSSATIPAGCNNQAIYRAFSAHNENQKIQVLGCGQVKKVLKDDNDGSRHQKFLISIDGYPQMTVLVAHNIDLAKRVDNITANTPIRFYGEYIYNDKGGVLHWTHKDPAARHQDGWLEYNGQKYW